MKSLEEVQQIKEQIEDELMQVPGVNGVGIRHKTEGDTQTDTLAIVVYVDDKAQILESGLIPQEVHAVPIEIVQRRFTPHN